MKKIRKIVKHIMAIAVMVGLITSLTSQNIKAQEAVEKVEEQVNIEYLEKKEAGLEVYELLDENGMFIGYYEPYSESNPEPVKMARLGSSISWEVPSGKYVYGTNIYDLSDGVKIYVNITQSIKGTSYLTFHNRSTNSSLRFTNTKVDNGWKGTITLASIKTAKYSFGIENASSKSITYMGSYSL